MTLAACCPIVGDAVGAAVGDRDPAVGAAEGTAVGASDADELKGVGAWEKKRNEPRRQRGWGLKGGTHYRMLPACGVDVCTQYNTSNRRSYRTWVGGLAHFSKTLIVNKYQPVLRSDETKRQGASR